MRTLFAKFTLLLLAGILLAGCGTTKPYDYTAFKESRPRSILVLPPLNNSPEVAAPYSMLSQVSYPLAESGYYVFPVSLVDNTFKQNGLTTAADIHAVPTQKLNQIFGADAALYITIEKYGVKYMILDSAAIVTARAKLVDLKTGQLLWEGAASASSNEGDNNSGGLAAMLVTALIKQVANNVLETSHKMAGITSSRLLFAGRPNGMLFGPRSPAYGKD